MIYRLGTAIAQIIPFHRIQLQHPNKDDGVITTKLIKIMVITTYLLETFLDLTNHLTPLTILLSPLVLIY
jgi:hypothetical protein